MDGLSQASQVLDMATFDRLLHEHSGRESDDEYNCKVLITGSTGSMGSYLLCKLLESPSVDRVIFPQQATTVSEENQYDGQRHTLSTKGTELPEAA